jgi:hypothetical protein
MIKRGYGRKSHANQPNTKRNHAKECGFLFSIVLVPRYKLSLCHTPIKPDYLAFRELMSLRVSYVTI